MMEGAPNRIVVLPGRAPIEAPAPPALPGKLVVRRLSSFVPAAILERETGRGRISLLAKLAVRYPSALRKAVDYVREEGWLGTVDKIRCRLTLERWNTSAGLFSVVGEVVTAADSGPAVGEIVLAWALSGPVDADYFLVAPEHSLPLPSPEPDFAVAPWVGWIASILRSIGAEGATCRVEGLDERLARYLNALAASRPGERRRAVVGAGEGFPRSREPGEIAVRLLAERSRDPLVTREGDVWTVRLPDPGYYFLDPLFPGAPEDPEPFTALAVREGVELVGRAASVARPRPPAPTPVPERTLRLAPAAGRSGRLRVSALGAGFFVRAILVPRMRRHARIELRGVMDVRPEMAAAQARAMGAAFCTTDPAAIFADEATDLVLVVSDHASHAAYTAAALRAGKMVHVEKPPVVTREQLRLMLGAVREVGPRMIHVGYNRPFAPAVQDLEREMEALEGPTFVTCIVKGHRLGRAHWYNWPNQGTRIAGNVMHWIDLGYRLTGRRRPLWVDVTVPREEGPSVWDARALAVGFDDGSLLSVVFSAAGDETFGVQEYIDVKRQGLSAAIDNYRTLELVREGRRRRRRYGRDKGHDGEIAAMVRKALERKGDEHTVADMVATSCILFAARDAMAAGGGRQPVVLEAFP